jgi:hypothetical protein
MIPNWQRYSQVTTKVILILGIIADMLKIFLKITTILFV